MKQVATLSRYWLVEVAAALGMLTGCSGQPSAPVAATLQVSLSTPFADDGALLFTVTGGRVDSVDAPGYTLYTSQTDPATLQDLATEYGVSAERIRQIEGKAIKSMRGQMSAL